MRKNLFCFVFVLLFFINANKLYSQPSAGNLHFGIVTDVQYCDCDSSGQRYYRMAPGKLSDAMDVLEEANIDFLLNLGDLVDRDLSSYDTILPILHSKEIEVYSLLGNHEFTDIPDSEKSSLFERLNMPSPYYSFVENGWRFVFLNSNDISTYAYSEGSEASVYAGDYIKALGDNPNAHEWNGGIGEKQMQWLDSLLSSSDTLGEHVIVASHHNIFPLSIASMLNGEELSSLLESHNSVKLVIAGHHHEGSFVEQNGLHYWTAKAMLDYPDQTAFSIVDIRDNEISIDGYGREPDRVITYESDFNLFIQDGTGYGRYPQGEFVIIEAIPPSPDQKFSHWSGDVSILETPDSPIASFQMPAFDVNLRAVFKTK